MIRFFVAGAPKALSVTTTVNWRSRDGRRGAFQRRRHEGWAALIGREGLRYAPPTPYDGGIRLAFRFLLARPPSTPKRITLPLRRPDVDNLASKISDAWNGVFWHDDAQVVDLHVSKRFTRDGCLGVEVTVEPVGADPGARGEMPSRPRSASHAEPQEGADLEEGLMSVSPHSGGFRAEQDHA